MRRVALWFAVLAVCMALLCPVYAAAETFVPSIGYKDGPEIKDADIDKSCLEVTSLKEAKDKTTDIKQEERDLLWEVYQKLSDGTMKLPLDGDKVIRELVDVSFKDAGCRGAGHEHAQWLSKEGNTVKITFELGVKKNTEVDVLVYVDDTWVEAESVVNNGDGTLTVILEELCPLAFCVDAKTPGGPAQTGDAAGQNLVVWVVIMVVSLAAVVLLLVNRRRLTR